MFVRIKKFKNQDGTIRRYLFLVASKRIGGRARQKIIANIGRIEEADKRISEIIEKLSKYRKKMKCR